MIIDLDLVHRLFTAEFCCGRVADEETRRRNAAGLFADIYEIDIDPEDIVVHHTSELGSTIWYTWQPGQRPSELLYGPGDGKIYPDCNVKDGVELRLFDHEKYVDGRKELIETLYYRLGGWNTETRRWVLVLEGMKV